MKRNFFAFLISVTLITLAASQANARFDLPKTPTTDWTKVDEKYDSLGGETSVLGAPVGQENIAPDKVGHFRIYQYGAIYWTPETGAHEVHGDIFQKWASLKAERFLGYPVTDELTTDDGLAQFNNFQNGAIDWTENTGAHALYGEIKRTWDILATSERQKLGYPTSDEEDCAFGRVVYFEFGRIYWSAERGTKVVLDDAGSHQ